MAEGRPGRSAVCFSDPDVFAAEMIRMINDTEYRYLMDHEACVCGDTVVIVL